MQSPGFDEGEENSHQLCAYHQVVFQTGRAAMIAQFTMTKHTDHFGQSKLSIQNLIGIHFGVSRSPSTQNVTLAYYSLAGSQAQTSVRGVHRVILLEAATSVFEDGVRARKKASHWLCLLPRTCALRALTFSA